MERHGACERAFARSAIAVAVLLSGFAIPAAAQELLLEVAGEATSDGFGTALARLADVDADGIDDLVVGAPGSSTLAVHGGAAYLVSTASGAILATWRGTVLDAQLGTAVECAGDVDLDGTEDVALAAPSVAGGTAPGEVRICSGATGGVLRTLVGTAAGDTFGMSCTALGDLGGDGVPELVVGAPYVATWFVYDGATGGEIYRLTSPQPTSNSGWATAALGDVDGDGLPDLAIGAPTWRDSNNVVVGRVQIRAGSNGALIRTHLGENTNAFGTDGFGAELVALDDVDGDGVRDYAIGAGGFGKNNEGRVYVHSGATGVELARHDGARGDFAGTLLASGGDLDRDGRGDLLLGLPLSGGTQSGRVVALAGGDWSEITRVSGGDDERVGAGLADAADLDHDGHADLLLAAIGGATGFTGHVRRYGCLPPAIDALSPDRADHRADAPVSLTGQALRAESGLVAKVDGVEVPIETIWGPTRIDFTIGGAAAGPATVEVATRFGSATTTFLRTPAVTIAGDFTPGGSGTCTVTVSDHDEVMVLGGLGPPVSIPTPPYRGALAISPYFVVWVDPGVEGGRLDLPFDIDDDPSLIGLEILGQALAGPKLGGKGKDGGWSNCAAFTIE